MADYKKDRYEESLPAAEQPSLRDQFAMAALTGLISHHGNCPNADCATAAIMATGANYAYQYADAMMWARK